jgi:hypothetical protein
MFLLRVTCPNLRPKTTLLPTEETPQHTKPAPHNQDHRLSCDTRSTLRLTSISLYLWDTSLVFPQISPCLQGVALLPHRSTRTYGVLDLLPHRSARTYGVLDLLPHRSTRTYGVLDLRSHKWILPFSPMAWALSISRLFTAITIPVMTPPASNTPAPKKIQGKGFAARAISQRAF